MSQSSRSARLSWQTTWIISADMWTFCEMMSVVSFSALMMWPENTWLISRPWTRRTPTNWSALKPSHRLSSPGAATWPPTSRNPSSKSSGRRCTATTRWSLTFLGKQRTPTAVKHCSSSSISIISSVSQSWTVELWDNFFLVTWTRLKYWVAQQLRGTKFWRRSLKVCSFWWPSIKRQFWRRRQQLTFCANYWTFRRIARQTLWWENCAKSKQNSCLNLVWKNY